MDMPLAEALSVYGFARNIAISSDVKLVPFPAMVINSPFLSQYITSDLACHASFVVCLPCCAVFAVHFREPGIIHCPYYGAGALWTVHFPGWCIFPVSILRGVFYAVRVHFGASGCIKVQFVLLCNQTLLCMEFSIKPLQLLPLSNKLYHRNLVI